MPEIKVVDMAGKEVGKVALSDRVFAAEVNAPVLHAAVRAYLSNQRQGTQSTLTRTEVSGGGRKPWRQKGSGRARQGSTSAPQWTHGVGPVHRQVGSMGANSSPSRVFKNKHMAGQYGNEQVTILNLEVVKVDTEKNLIAVKGAVPGAKGGIVFIRDGIKA